MLNFYLLIPRPLDPELFQNVSSAGPAPQLPSLPIASSSHCGTAFPLSWAAAVGFGGGFAFAGGWVGRGGSGVSTSSTMTVCTGAFFLFFEGFVGGGAAPNPEGGGGGGGGGTSSNAGMGGGGGGAPPPPAYMDSETSE